MIRIPLETANFLSMADESSDDRIRTPNIVMYDTLVPGPAGEDMIVPGQRSYAAFVAA